MKRRSRELSVPDITPLIDVVFLLLIFFMVSTVFKKEELSLLLSLPSSEQGEASETAREIIVIELSSEEVAFMGEARTFESLRLDLEAISDKSQMIELRIDKEVRYDRIVQLLDQLKAFDLTNLSLITDK